MKKLLGETDITILRDVRDAHGARGRVYYYEGNVYMPLRLHQRHAALVRSVVRQWLRENRDLVMRDRAKATYRTLTQLHDEAASWE